ncbi:MAG: deoxyribose-phosphate aldolase [Clostridiaceae bacterium BRH_c20a]|nr:MAG: deoxyribose-phosphate aldolase [Clostridiaceae bacterium BRH_c20a]
MLNVDIAKYIDHTILKPQTTEAEIVELCREAKQYGFAAVCVNPCYVNLAAKLLTGTKVKVATVIGFPLGANTMEVKAFEAERAFKEGAQEIDMVINIGALKSGKYDYVQEDIYAVVNVAKNQVPKKLVKVIIETSLLTNEEKEKACQLVLAAGADFVKTSTGFNGGGANLEDVQLMKRVVGEKVKIKASGGIRDVKAALLMIEAGAERLGTSSGVAIVISAQG